METSDVYDYPKLPPQHIRVLELQPASSITAGLACQLTIQKIQDLPYEALSYVWGKPTVFRSTIRCQDGTVETSAGSLAIGANLATALLVYRLPDRPRRLWVDAICIRQDDLLERHDQVRMMGDIFRNATQVLCWLGAFEDPSVDEPTALLAIDYLRQFNKDKRGHLRRIQAHLHDNTSEKDGHRLSRSWSAIKAFFDREYFHRAWIIQEIGLARRAMISWGSSQIYIDWREVAEFVLFLDDNGASVINHLELKSWVCNHINLVWSNDKNGKPVFDFSEILHWARVHLSTDPRDFVYSLLGHPSAVVDGVPIIEPTYTITTAEVYTTLAINVIKRMDSLHILAFVDHGEGTALLKLPTWVPDWHALNLVAPLRYPTGASGKEFDGITIDTSQEMATVRSRGFIVDKICAYSDMINPKELVVTDYGTENKKKIPFLFDHMYRVLGFNQASVQASTDYFIHSLSSILTGAYHGTTAAASGEMLNQQRADCAAYILDFEKVRTAKEPPGFVGSLTKEQRAKVETLASTGSASQFVQDMTWTSMCRKVFRTTEGHMGLGPRTLAHDDICVVLKGSVYPLILRQFGDQYQLIGPVLLYGFMDNEIEEAQRTGGCNDQDLDIC